MRPKVFTACEAMRATWSSAETSVSMPRVFEPVAFAISAAAWSNFCRSATTTEAPSCARRSASALPMPPPAPVTIATLPFNGAWLNGSIGRHAIRHQLLSVLPPRGQQHRRLLRAMPAHRRARRPARLLERQDGRAFVLRLRRALAQPVRVPLGDRGAHEARAPGHRRGDPRVPPSRAPRRRPRHARQHEQRPARRRLRPRLPAEGVRGLRRADVREPRALRGSDRHDSPPVDRRRELSLTDKLLVARRCAADAESGAETASADLDCGDHRPRNRSSTRRATAST